MVNRFEQKLVLCVKKAKKNAIFKGFLEPSRPLVATLPLPISGESPVIWDNNNLLIRLIIQNSISSGYLGWKISCKLTNMWSKRLGLLIIFIHEYTWLFFTYQNIEGFIKTSSSRITNEEAYIRVSCIQRSTASRADKKK